MGRLDYAVEDLKVQGWFDPFKTTDKKLLFLPHERQYQAVWNELDQLASDPLRELATVPEHEGRLDELGDPLEEGISDWDEKGRWMFHYQKGLGNTLRDHSEFALKYQQFLTIAGHLNDMALHIANELAKVFESQGYCSARLSRSLAEGGSAMTRFPHYRPGCASSAAPAHRDRSGLTIHWWESQPSLVFYDNERRVRTSPEDASAVCFPGRKLWASSMGHFPQLIHGVCDMRPLMMQEQNHRRAIVSFVHWPLSDDALRYIRNHPAESETYP
jgi:hypothetical protein